MNSQIVHLALGRLIYLADVDFEGSGLFSLSFKILLAVQILIPVLASATLSCDDLM